VIDHLVYGTPDLAATVEELSRRLGLELSAGGQHLGLGTRNYLADLGDRRYLEVVGPDPEQPDHVGGRLFGVDSLPEPRLVTWAARTDDLAALHRRAAERGADLGPIRAMRRDSADGFPISWLMTPPLADPEFGGLVPFVVEWGADSPHPADRAARGLRLVSLTALAPDVAPVQRRLAALGQDLPVAERAEPGLRAVLETPAGPVVLE
jgi:hypothetical protein